MLKISIPTNHRGDILTSAQRPYLGEADVRHSGGGGLLGVTWPSGPAEKPLGLLPAGWARRARMKPQKREGEEMGEGNPWENRAAGEPQERKEKRAEKSLKKDKLQRAFLFQSGGPGGGRAAGADCPVNAARLVCVAADRLLISGPRPGDRLQTFPGHRIMESQNYDFHSSQLAFDNGSIFLLAMRCLPWE